LLSGQPLTAAETIWIEAEHLDGIKDYCWPMGKPEMKKTNGHFGLSGPCALDISRYYTDARADDVGGSCDGRGLQPGQQPWRRQHRYVAAAQRGRGVGVGHGALEPGHAR
jgi:hypothetical protein